MLRALGFKTSYLVQLISLQSFMFSLPGLIGGLIVAAIMNVIVRLLVFIVAENYYSYSLGTGPLVLGTLFGIFMPFLAAILPIRSALGKNLRNSLDLNSRSQGQYSVSVQRI